MSEYNLQRHIKFIKEQSKLSCLRGDVPYFELLQTQLKLKSQSVPEKEPVDDDDLDPWCMCLFKMEPHRDPEPRSTAADKEAVKKKTPAKTLGPPVNPNVPEDLSTYGKYYGVDWVDSDSDSDEDDEEVPLPYGSKVLSKFPGHRVALLPDKTILKSGRSISFNEILALYLAGSIGVPVPLQYDRDWDQYARINIDGNITIRMEYIRGKTLLQRWPRLRHKQKVRIMEQLQELLVLLRYMFPPMGLIGSCDGREIRDSRAENTYFAPVCYSERQFNEYLLSTIAYAPDEMRAAYSRNLPQESTIVLCHGDLSPDNIILDRDLSVVGLLDWEDSGWYPEYWEYVKFFARKPMVPDWHEYAPHLFPKLYKKERKDFRCMDRYRVP